MWITKLIKKLIKKMKKKKHPNPPTPSLPRPTELSIVGTANDKVFLQFRDNSVDEERFELQRFIIPDVGDPVLDQTHDVPAQFSTGLISYIDTTVEPGAHYEYKIRAIKGELGAGGIASEFSNSITVVVPND